MALPPPLAARLAERNIQRAADLFNKTLLDLVELLDLPYDAVRQILHEVAARVTPTPVTVRAAAHAACCYYRYLPCQPPWAKLRCGVALWPSGLCRWI
jgi:hypothetical protein